MRNSSPSERETARSRPPQWIVLAAYGRPLWTIRTTAVPDWSARLPLTSAAFTSVTVAGTTAGEVATAGGAPPGAPDARNAATAAPAAAAAPRDTHAAGTRRRGRRGRREPGCPSRSHGTAASAALIVSRTAVAAASTDDAKPALSRGFARRKACMLSAVFMILL